MASQKKFGTFSGVLTPSLLTILGVIMYMRLGSVVGNSSGLFQVILIIVFAHLISVTTGLSVSSIATDKKIEKGGIYYMLTRSLGLPIGGAIGLTIFIATAFSISLYLIGFSESLIPVLNDSFGFGEVSINKLRLFGTIALCLVMLIAYISTSFALKIQYVILGLIALSLVSIFFGSSDGLQPGNDIIEAPSFSVLFGIFFPAVTGFTAGVAMSGDLKNPKISIPWGTMMAIVIGLIVYVLLATFIFYNIPSEILQTNNNVLIEFGAISVLVLGGVWGATLSSALGGILGGPRILQAMSIDKITPKLFAKGFGINNEPRNALLLTFFIAEIGILIGQLNVIAELVAMFYMAAYLFINVSCFLEQWSSPDFRPQFKIPIWTSLIGAIATFLLMIQLNLAATLVAVLVMLIIWFWLSKKDLVLGTGDVWFSVWTSIVKAGLKNLQKKSVHKRNWQPNILLFSGGTKNRPHLIEFSKSIIGRGGMVSNFDLIQVENANSLFPKPHQIVKDDQIKDDNIFHRRLYCQNVFKGIETIANTYGFSGIDPNTVLMGWARNTKDPIYFGEMTHKLKELDYNILFLDYDQKRTFGDYSEISIWWTSFEKECELGLQLVKFLRSSSLWKGAFLKIHFVNNLDESSTAIKEEINMLLDRKRMSAEILVINNHIEKKNLNELIRARSYNSSLTIMNFPLLKKGKEKGFISASNELFTDIGSALFLEASSNFSLSKKEKPISELNNLLPNLKTIDESKDRSSSFPELIKTFDVNFDANISNWQENLIDINKELTSQLESSFLNFSRYYGKVYGLNNLNDELQKNLYNTKELNVFCDLLEEEFSKSIENYFNALNTLFASLPKKIKFKYHLNFLESSVFEEFSDSKYLKSRTRYLSSKPRELVETIRLNSLIDYHLKNLFTVQTGKTLIKIGAFQLNFFHAYKLALNQLDPKFLSRELAKTLEDLLLTVKKDQDQLITQLLNEVILDIGKSDVSLIVADREEEFDPKKYRELWRTIEEFPYWTKKNSLILHNHKVMYCSALMIKLKVAEQVSSCENLFKYEIFDKCEEFIGILEKKYKVGKSSQLNSFISDVERSLSNTIRVLDISNWLPDVESIINQFPLELDLYYPDVINHYFDNQIELVEKNYYLQGAFKSIYLKEVHPKLNDIVLNQKEWVKKEVEELVSLVKLLVFTNENQKDKVLIKEVKEKLKLRILDFKDNITIQKERIDIELSDLLDYTSKFLDDQYLIEHNSRRVVALDNDGNNNYIKKFNQLQYFLSEKFVELVKFITPDDTYVNQFSKSDKLLEIRNFISRSSISDEVSSKVSKMYLQLFSSKIQANSFFSAYIIPQIKQIEAEIENVNENTENVILINGDPQSGKSYMMEQVLKNRNYKNCFAVDPPASIEGSSVEELVENLLYDMSSEKSFDKTLGDINSGALVFVNDFELWWRKGDIGLEAVNEWIKLFEKYKHKLCFIVEINSLLLDHLMLTTDLAISVRKSVATTHFNKSYFHEIINQKNSMADQTIYYKGNKINFKTLSRSVIHFRKIQKKVFGNIGWFNTFWLSSLKVVNDNCEIQPNYNLEFPPHLSDDELTVLLQFYWHKRIHVDSFESCFSFLEKQHLNEILSFLKAEKLLLSVGNAMELNYHITPYLKAFFLKNNFIKA